jgi:biopolymer transport protein ExbD
MGRSRKPSGPDKVEQQMTPMIDIVFQLLTFFVMSFKIATQEGDFNVKMPLAAPSAGVSEEPFPPIKVRLVANSNGTLNRIQVGDRPMSGFPGLHNEIMGIVGGNTGPGSMAEKMEVELDCDYGLHYSNVVNAITAISGSMNADGQIIKLIEKIKFAPPRPPR